jgi:phosphatidylinositol-3-phosphatase
MQSDCQVYSQFAGTGTVAPGQAVGSGCVFPTSVPNLTDQLQAQNLSWKGYMEDMGTPCRHPALDTTDPTQKATIDDQYAVRHNPFMYFSSIINSPSCGQHVVDLTQLTTDLASTTTTPNLSYITPNLCHDGHDSPCVDGQPSGLASVDDWMRTWVPKILNSPAYKADGVPRPTTYSLLASIEDIFRLPYLGYAQTPGLNRFGLDVYNSGWHLH